MAHADARRHGRDDAGLSPGEHPRCGPPSRAAVNARLTRLSRSIAGRRAIVTGAASGMGRATAHLFADEGARVAVVDIERERVNAVVQEIIAVHGSEAAVAVPADITAVEAPRRIV